MCNGLLVTHEARGVIVYVSRVRLKLRLSPVPPSTRPLGHPVGHERDDEPVATAGWAAHVVNVSLAALEVLIIHEIRKIFLHPAQHSKFVYLEIRVALTTDVFFPLLHHKSYTVATGPKLNVTVGAVCASSVALNVFHLSELNPNIPATHVVGIICTVFL
jgi:hypothetical protein